jgi:O-antigen/teichoic acid export membrane protein
VADSFLPAAATRSAARRFAARFARRGQQDTAECDAVADALQQQSVEPPGSTPQSSRVWSFKPLAGLASSSLTGPIPRNVGAAATVQFCLLVSGTLGARLLGPEKRGYLAILVAWPSAIAQLGAVGMSLAATYFLSARLISGSEVIAVLRRSAAIQITVLTMVNAAVILGYTLISGAPIFFAACLSLAILPFGVCLDYGIAFLLGTRRHGAASAMRVIGPATYAIGILVVYLWHIRSLAVVVALVALSVLLAGVRALTSGLSSIRTVQVNDSIVKKLGLPSAKKTVMAFGRKGYVGYLSPVDTFRIDQLVVGFLLSPRALGIYVVGAAFTNFGRMVATYIGVSATPEIAACSNPLDRHRAVQRTLLLAGGVLTVLTIALGSLVIVAIPVLFGNAYRSAIPVAEILLVAGWLLSMKRIAVDTMRGVGEARVGTRAEAVNLGVFLAACVPLGLLLGDPGVALGLVVASACGSLVLLHGLRQLDVVPTLPFRSELGKSKRPGRPSALRISRSGEAITLAGIGTLGAIGLGILGDHLYALTIALLTLGPLISHGRHVGVRKILTEPSAITVIVWFYFFVFPLRALVVVLSGYSDLMYLRVPITSSDVVSMLLLASAATTVLVESYYFAYSRRAKLPTIAVRPAERHGPVVRLAAVLTTLSFAGLSGVIVAHGGLAGARAAFVQHDITAALQGKSTVFDSAWALFSVPAVWCCAYVVFNVGSRKWTRRVFAIAAVMILAAALEIYGSRLSALLALIGAWLVYFYSGRRVPARLVLVALGMAILLSQPILSARQSVNNQIRLSTVERYSRITGYGVLDVSLAIQRAPDRLRAEVRDPTRWLDLPAYFVPAALWHSKPNLAGRRLGIYTARELGNARDWATGLPSTYVTEGWLLGGWPGAIILSALFGSALGWAVRGLTRVDRPSPAAVLYLAFVVTAAWTYYKDGDLLETIVAQGRDATYLALLMWATGVIGPRWWRVGTSAMNRPRSIRGERARDLRPLGSDGDP